MMNDLNIQIKRFSELQLEEVYQLLKLRVDIFVVEQQCAYQELDNKDQSALHVFAYYFDELIGCARILFEDDMLHIGRIAVLPAHRKKGVAQNMLAIIFKQCSERWPNEDMYISAQAHLENYYQQFGFETTSEAYDWDGILHVDMKKKALPIA